MSASCQIICSCKLNRPKTHSASKTLPHSIRLNAEEFLRHFKPGGHSLALEEVLSPIGVMGGSVPQSSQDHQQDTAILKDREQPFEELVKHKFPGIRYCLDLEKAQKKEDHFAKMQQKLVWNETSCTCTMEQAASPATMEIRTTKSKPGVKGQTRRKLTDSAKKKMLRGVKRKSEDTESSQANKRRLLGGNAVEETFAKPTSTPRVRRKSQSLSSPRGAAVRSSPRRQNQLSKVAGMADDGKRRASTSSLSSSSKVTTVTFDAAGRKRPSRSSSLSGSSSGGQRSASGGQRSASSSGGQRSRKQKHTELLQGIVHELLNERGINKDHPIYTQCSKRLFNMTKEYVRALPPKSYSSLTDEMKNIASQNVEFVVGFEEKLYTAKEKK
ncbi:mdm2-binding protein-like [Amphiura filiformis]|uniref:mdm2-binding protein-like n=1 Tax=Amphiura filiformis TaxID=82378 RepID=UPI003B218FD3